MEGKKKHIDPAQREKYVLQQRSGKEPEWTFEGLRESIERGDRYALSRAITLVEKEGSMEDPMVTDLLDWAETRESDTYRIAITGSPGVGKSTFIEALGKEILEEDLTIAILAIDPSSQITKGSILGDKTRMEELSKLENVFIRPSPAGSNLGGVARQTRHAIALCEAAGFDIIIVETVGVGQSETIVHSMVDLFVLLLQPGEGDELQGIKKGIVEMSDLIIVNKADGPNVSFARQTRADYKNALHYSGSKHKDWSPVILTASAMEGSGLDEVWGKVNQFFKHIHETGKKESLRKEQNEYWFDAEFRSMLIQGLFKKSWYEARKEQYLDKVSKGKLSSHKASMLFVEEILKQVK